MILITGASGFIGRHVVQELLQNYPQQKIRVLLRSSEKAFFSSGVECIKGNISDKEALNHALKNVDAIIHLAHKTIDYDNTGFNEINVEGTRLLCKLAVSKNIKKIVFLSTVGVYGHHVHRDTSEKSELNPDTPFSKSKLEAEKILLKHHNNQHFQTIILRPRFVYGEGDLHVIPKFIKWAKNYNFLLDGGRAKVSLISVNDFAKIICILTVLNIKIDSSPIYNATDGMPKEIREIIKVICNIFDLNFPAYSVPSWILFHYAQLKELITGTEPEKSLSPISSIRIKMVTQDNYFSNKRLLKLIGDFKFDPFIKRFQSLSEYYSSIN